MRLSRTLVPRLVLLLAVAALLLGFGGTGFGGTGQAEQPPLRVLFVGNSLTASNDLPSLVAALGRARGIAIEYEAVTPGGFDLSDQWNGQASTLLAQREWNAVVLQQGPSALASSQLHLREWATRWAEAIRARGATPALYGVWPEGSRRYALPAVIASYRNAASASGSMLLPAGDAWRVAWRRSPSLRLYGPDGFHPSTTGTYLAALTVYAGLTKTSPVGLPRTIEAGSVKVSLTARVAKTLQLSAAEALARR